MNEMKSGKAPGLDGFPEECLKKDGNIAVLELLVTVECKFSYGGCTYGLGQCMYSSPVQREG